MSDPFGLHRGSIPESYLDALEKSRSATWRRSPPTERSTTPPSGPTTTARQQSGQTPSGGDTRSATSAGTRTTISVTDPENPYRWLSVRGEATFSTDGATEHIGALAARYLDADSHPHHDEAAEPRVTVSVPADRVTTRGRPEDR